MNQALTDYINAYPAISAHLPGQLCSALQTQRAQAFAEFSTQGFPAQNEEEWRYTPLSALEKKAFVPSQPDASAITLQDIAAYRLAEAYTLVIVDGHYRADLSERAGLPDGIQIQPIAEALSQHPEQIMRYLGQSVGINAHNLIAFNTAWFTDGLYINLPAGHALEKPIQCLHINTQEGGLSATRNLLVLGEHSKLQWLETYIGQDTSYLTVAVTEAFIGEQAELTAHKVQSESEKAYHFGGLYIQQAVAAQCTHHNFAFGGLIARTDLHSDLQQTAHCQLNGLTVGHKRQHIDNHTRINHNQAEGTSRELYKNILTDRARGVFQGRIVVARDAQQTDASMDNRNLLLSDTAEVDTKPQLEIYADDVKCAHGVTVGQLDEKSVFYLQSRGLDPATAQHMLTFAFANEMVDKITLPALKTQLLDKLLKYFPQPGYAN